MSDQTDEIVNLYTFTAGKHLFAVKASDIKEVKDDTEVTGITPVFHADDYVEGYINLRGEINLVLDLRKMLDCGNPLETRRDLILFKEELGPSFGVLVDHAEEIINVHPNMIEEWHEQQENTQDSSCNRFTYAICKTKDQLISILDPKRFLPESVSAQ